MNLPEQLCNKNFRFVKIAPGKKKPTEPNWTTENNYRYNEESFKKFMKTAKNYGVVCGYGNLAIVDCDKQEVAQAVQMSLPTTLTVKTGSGGYHFYFIIDDLKKKIIIEDENTHYGEVQYTGFQCVGPGSLHPSGEIYKIETADNIKKITKKELFEVLEPYLKKDKPEFGYNESELDLPIKKLLAKINGLKEHGDEWQGPHPIHGSTNGGNIGINVEKNFWHCFRHNTGGDALSLVGVLEGVIQCEDCTKGYFRKHPDKFKEILKVAPKYKYKIPKLKTKRKKPGYKNPQDLLLKYEVYYENMKGNTALSFYNLAKLIKEEHGNFLIVADKSDKSNEIYYYKEGYFQNIGRNVIQQWVNTYLGKAVNEHIRNEVLGAFNTMEAIERSDLEPETNLINLNNGVLDINTMKLSPHDPKYKFLNKIPINYKPKAKCKKTQKFFTEVLKEDAIAPMQEMFGYCLFRGYKIHSLFIMRGTGRNGKGVTMRLLKAMLGMPNVCARKLHEIAADQHARADLYCKFATLSGEMKYDDIKDNSLIKELSGEDVITARRLYKESFEFENYAKLIFATNNLPPSADMNIGWLDRLVFFEFPKVFDKSNKKTRENLFEDSLSKELEGLLIWSLEGLKRLLDKGKFSNQPHYNVKGAMWESFCNTVETWYEERIEESISDSEEITTVLYKDYLEWCEESQFSPESRVSFGRKLNKTVKVRLPIMTRKRDAGGRVKRMLEGVKLRKTH